MWKPVKVCFKHERMRVADTVFVQLQKGTVDRLADFKLYAVHTPCDYCRAEQPRLFDRSEQ